MSDTPRRLVERLRSFAEAYPEDIFIPLTAEETKTYSSIITRASGGMGRHFATFAVSAADEIERLQAELAARDAEEMDAAELRALAFRQMDCAIEKLRNDLADRDAEIERLRNALEELVECERTDGQADGPSYTHWVNAWKRGRAAIAQAKEPT